MLCGGWSNLFVKPCADACNNRQALNERKTHVTHLKTMRESSAHSCCSGVRKAEPVVDMRRMRENCGRSLQLEVQRWTERMPVASMKRSRVCRGSQRLWQLAHLVEDDAHVQVEKCEGAHEDKAHKPVM